MPTCRSRRDWRSWTSPTPTCPPWPTCTWSSRSRWVTIRRQDAWGRAVGQASPAPAPRSSVWQALDLTANRLRQLEPKLLGLTGLRRLCLRQNLLTSAAEVPELQSAPGERPGRLFGRLNRESSSSSPDSDLNFLPCSAGRAGAERQPVCGGREGAWVAAVAARLGGPPHSRRLGQPATRTTSPPPLQVPELRAFSALRCLELSYNEIRSLAPLASLPGTALTELYAASNKVAAIAGLEHLTGREERAAGRRELRAGLIIIRTAAPVSCALSARSTAAPPKLRLSSFSLS